jgi:hypothetical protein
MTRSHSSPWLNILHCVHVPHFLYSFIHWSRVRLFPFLGCCGLEYKGAKMSIWHIGFISFEYMPSSRIDGSYGSSIFNFMGNIHTIFCKEWSIYGSTKDAQEFPFLYPCQLLLSLVFLMIVIIILFEVQWYLIVALIYIFLMINDFEHFMLLGIFMYSLENAKV